MSLNPVTDHGQPFTGDQRVILEKRTEEGILDLSDPQPPLKVRGRDLTLDDVYALYFREHAEAGSCSWGTLRAWLDSKSWVVRAKIW
jgi:hypothetical protein